MQFSILPLFLSIIPMFCWGTMDFLSGRLSRKENPLVGVFIVHILSILISLPLLIFNQLNLSNLPAFFLISVLPLLSWVLFMKAAKMTDISVIGPVSRTDLLASSSLGIIFLGESVTMFKILGILLVFAGGVMISFDWSKLKELKKVEFMRGVPWAFLGAMCLGTQLFFMAPMSRNSDWFSVSLIIRSIVALYLFLMLAGKKQTGEILKSKIPMKLMFAIAFVDVIALGVYNFAVTTFEVSFVSVIASCAALVTIILARIILKEKLHRLQQVGAVLIIAGIIGLQIY